MSTVSTIMGCGLLGLHAIVGFALGVFFITLAVVTTLVMCAAAAYNAWLRQQEPRIRERVVKKLIHERQMQRNGWMDERAVASQLELSYGVVFLSLRRLHKAGVLERRVRFDDHGVYTQFRIKSEPLTLES